MPNWKDKIRNPECELCPLHEEAEWVCLMGSGPKIADLMIVGEAPGAREDESHQAFVGPAGRLLDKALQSAGLDRKDCYVTNAAKCRPPDNRAPERSEAKICTETYLLREIRKVRPRLILLLGNTALRAVTGKSGITKHRGTPFELADGTVAIATFHPAAVLRNPRYGYDLAADLNRVRRLLLGEKSEAPPTRVSIIRTQRQLALLKRKLMVAEEISFDLETTGLHEWMEGGGIVSISFSFEEGRSFVVPLFHKSKPWKDWQKVLKYLKPGLEREDAKYIAQNGKFDCRWLAAFGVYVWLWFDTMIAAHMVDENRPKGLKYLSDTIIGADDYDVGKGEDVKDFFYFNLPLGALCIYNGKDTDYTLRLYHLFREQLKAEPRSARVFSKLMIPASNVLTQVEAVGMYVDEERLLERKMEAEENVEKLRKYLRQYMPKGMAETINFNSPQQVGAWLFGHLKLPILETTKTDMPSTKESVMLRLADKHPACKALLKYRTWAKYLSTYIEAWDELRDSRSRLHTSYQLAHVVTGRLSSRKPNLQQVPRNKFIRSIIGAPPGWSFVDADYSQIELRIAAMLANETTLLRIFHTGGDPHLSMAAEIAGLTEAEVLASDKTGKTEHRKRAKPVNFGFLYGMGEKKFGTYAFDNYGVKFSPQECHHARTTFFRSYPRLRAWHDRQRRIVRQYERVYSPIGRVRHLSDVRSGEKSVRAEAERQAINSPVQSCASDLMLMSLVRLSPMLRPSTARIVGTVHDSILFEVRDECLDQTLPLIHRIMTDMRYPKKVFGANITVPIEVEIKVGKHWAEGEVWDV